MVTGRMTWPQGISALLIALFICTSSLDANERNYPFPRKKPVTIGSEHFHPEYMSLQGLEGVYMDLEGVESALLRIGSEMPQAYKNDIHNLVTESGLLLLDEDNLRWTPGQPMLNIWPTLNVEKIDPLKEFKDVAVSAAPELAAALGEPSVEAPDIVEALDTLDDPAEEQLRCDTSLWVGFSQSAALLRQPLREYRLSSWGAGDSMKSCEERGEWLMTAVRETIESFIKDYKKAQKEQMPTIVSRIDDLPRNCAQSWMIVNSVFEINETIMISTAQSIVEKFVELTADCNGFGYVVEAHDDNHADPQYNQILRTARTETIKELMNSHGIHFKRIKLRAKNEEVPFVSGTMDNALLKGSVIIYPQSSMEFSNLDLEL